MYAPPWIGVFRHQGIGSAFIDWTDVPLRLNLIGTWAFWRPGHPLKAPCHIPWVIPAAS